MKQMILLAGAAALFASAAPAYAKPGHAKGHGKAAHAHKHQGQGALYGYGGGGCPPGLQKKGCMPPGQAKKMFNIGQRVPVGYNGLLGYYGLPTDLRGYYGAQLDPYSRYIHDQNYIYRVDPKTMLVQQVLSAILRP